MAGRNGSALAAVLVGAAIAVAAMPAPVAGIVALYDPTTGYTEHRGVLTQGEEDDWGSGGCSAAEWAFTIELSVEADLQAEDGDPAVVEVEAVDKLDEGGWGTVSAVATAGAPVTLAVTQPSDCLDMTVRGLHVPGAVVYEVTCMDGCTELYLPGP